MKHPLLTVTLLLMLAGTASAAPITFEAAGATAAAIQPALDNFRNSLGTLNANTAVNNQFGRREINWDGVPEGSSSPNAFPGNFFNAAVAGRARGIDFQTPGSALQVSANAGAGVQFGNLDPSYPGLFEPFSPNKLFTAVGSNVTDVRFFLPADQTTPASVIGFGAVFSDVDLANSTSLQFFDASGNSLGTFAVPNFAGNQTFSFFGLTYNDGTRIGRVRITSGNVAPGPGALENLATSADVVTMDDFIYGEPGGSPIPEPGTLLLLSGGLAAIALRRRR